MNVGYNKSVECVLSPFTNTKKSDSAIEPTLYRPEDFQEEDLLVWEILHNGIKISTIV